MSDLHSVGCPLSIFSLALQEQRSPRLIIILEEAYAFFCRLNWLNHPTLRILSVKIGRLYVLHTNQPFEPIKEVLRRENQGLKVYQVDRS